MKQKMAELITKDMTIGEVVQKYPHAAEVLTNFGLHCIGCHVSPFETIEQGAMGHGMDTETITKMVEEANKVAATAPKKTVMKSTGNADIVFTEKAVEKIKEIMKNEGKDGQLFRVGIMPGGCSGFSYALSFEEKKEAEDIEMDKSGLKVIVNPASLEMLNGANIDFVESLQGTGFKIDNPNATKSCGCGHSFG